MEPLRELQNLISQVTSKSPTRNHREVYNFIERVVLSPKSPIARCVPSLDTVLISIRGFVFPSFDASCIPDLLDLLATVEYYRRRILDQAHAALVWNKYYKSDCKKSTVTLAIEEEAFLRSLSEKNDSTRKIYIQTLQHCCHLDMYRLWTQSPPSLANFLIRFNEYFPSLNPHTNGKSPRLFHNDLSEEEKVQLAHLGVDCCNFAEQTITWAAQHGLLLIHDAFRMRSFEDEFLCNFFPQPEHQTVAYIEFFTKYVHDASKRMEEIFPGA